MGGFLEARDDTGIGAVPLGDQADEATPARARRGINEMAYLSVRSTFTIFAGVACTLRKREVAPIGFAVKRLESDSTVRKVTDTPRKVRGRRRNSH
jgi:hypothetical protein